MTNLDSCVKKQRYYFANKGPNSQGSGLFSSHIWMWELDNKEGRALKNWCFWTVVLEKTRESPLESKEVKPVNLNGNRPWILFGRTGAEAETLILWPPDANSWLIGKDWCWERLKAEREEGNRGRDGWVVLPIQLTRTWANSGRWWGDTGVFQSMGRQRIGHDLVTGQQQCIYIVFLINYSKSTTLMYNRNNRENSVYMWGEEGYGTSLYLFFL